MCIPGTPGVVGTAWLQGLMGKAGKDPEHRRSVWECEMPTTPIVQGLADQAVVTMTSPIISRRSEGPMDTVVSGVLNGMGYCQLADYQTYFIPALVAGITFPESLQQRRSAHQTAEGKDIHDRGTRLYKSADLQEIR